MPAARFYCSVNFSTPCLKDLSLNLVSESSDWTSELENRLGSPRSNPESASFVVDAESPSLGTEQKSESRASREDWCKIIRVPVAAESEASSGKQCSEARFETKDGPEKGVDAE